MHAGGSNTEEEINHCQHGEAGGEGHHHSQNARCQRRDYDQPFRIEFVSQPSTNEITRCSGQSEECHDFAGLSIGNLKCLQKVIIEVQIGIWDEVYYGGHGDNSNPNILGTQGS